MENLLFANVDVNGVDKQGWCRYEAVLEKGKIDAKANTIGMRFNCYHARCVSSDDLNVFAYSHEAEALVLTENGTKDSSGFVLVAAGSELFVENKYAAGYIGSTKPWWIPAGGTVFEKEMAENLSDTSWLHYSVPKKAPPKVIKEKLAPLIFHLLSIKRNGGNKKLVCICKDASEMSEMWKLLKRALMALPFQLSNQYSFVINATAEQLEISDVSCVTRKAIERADIIGKENLLLLEFPYEPMDEEQLSESSFCQYLFEDGVIPNKLDPCISTVEELERTASDIRLENYCRNRISCTEADKAIRLYNAANKDFIASSSSICRAFAQLAQDIFFSSFYSQVDTKTLGELVRFLNQEGNDNKALDAIDADVLLNELLQENNDSAVQHLCDLYKYLTETEYVPQRQKELIINLLFGRVNDAEKLFPIWRQFIERLDLRDFEEFLQLSEVSNMQLREAIVDKALKLDESNGGLNIYLNISEDNTPEWLFSSIVTRMTMRSVEELDGWMEFKEKLDATSYPEESLILDKKFSSSFEALLNRIGFYKSADQVLEAIKTNVRETIFSAAEKFNYSTKRFIEQRNKIIQLAKRDEAIESLKSRALIPWRKKQVKAPEKLVKKSTLNHLKINMPVLLLCLFVQLIVAIGIFYLTANLAIWDILSAITHVFSVAEIRTLFVGIPLIVCMVIYIIVIWRAKQYEAKLVAKRACAISTLTVIMPIILFLLTMGILFH